MMTSRGLAWLLVGWLLVLGPFALLESFNAPMPQGVLDGDDDDGAVGAPTHLGVSFEAAIPTALPPRVPSSAHLVMPEADRPLPAPPAASRSSRSPPLP